MSSTTPDPAQGSDESIPKVPTVIDEGVDEDIDAESGLPKAVEHRTAVERGAGPDTPDAEEMIVEIEKADQRTQRLQRNFAIAAAVLAVVVIPLGVLVMNENFSTTGIKEITQPLPERVDTVTGRPIARPTPPPVNPVAADMATYVGVLLPTLVPYEQAALDAYAATTGEKFKSEADSARKIREEVVPRMETFIAHAEAIRPQTEAVRAIHDRYLDIQRTKVAAFREMGKAGGKDKEWSARAAERLKEVDEKQVQYARMAEDLARRLKLGSVAVSGVGTATEP